MPIYHHGIPVVDEEDVLKTLDRREESVRQALSPLTAHLQTRGATDVHYLFTPNQPRSPLMEARSISCDQMPPVGTAQLTYDIEGSIAMINLHLAPCVLGRRAVHIRFPSNGNEPKARDRRDLELQLFDSTPFSCTE